MANNLAKALVTPVCLIIAGIMVYKGAESFQILAERTKAQQAETEKVLEWRSTYRALAVSMVEWRKNYRAAALENNWNDAIQIAAFEKHGVETDVDNLLVSAVDSVKSGDVAIGMSRVCLATSVGDASTLFLRATTYEQLMAGLVSLSKRPDVEIAGISLLGSGPFPVAKLSGFCLRVRDAGEN